VAGVQDDLQGGPPRQIPDDTGEIVITDPGSVPVEVMGADNLILAVRRLVSVRVSNLRTMARVVEHEHVSCRRMGNERFQPLQDCFPRGSPVRKEPHVWRQESEILHKNVIDVRDVVHAPLEIVLGARIVVDPDEKSLSCHHFLPSNAFWLAPR
jgi:hypothetical protein